MLSYTSNTQKTNCKSQVQFVVMKYYECNELGSHNLLYRTNNPHHFKPDRAVLDLNFCTWQYEIW